MTEIQEVYTEDTKGRKYHTPTMSKKGLEFKEPPIPEPVLANLNQPMTRGDFVKLTDSSKIWYIKGLKSKYGVTATQVAAMLGYSRSHFNSYVLGHLGLTGLFDKKGGRMSKTKIEAWNKFLENSQDKSNTILSKDKGNTDKSMVLTKQTEAENLLCNCSLTLKGDFKLSDITDKITKIILGGNSCSLNVDISATN